MTFEQSLAWAVLGEFFSDRMQQPPPRFPLACQVRCTWIDEFGQTWIDYGRVVGLFPAPPNWLEGWWYTIRFDQQHNDRDWLQLPYFDDWHEADLELME